ncbi:hypothetical protein [Bacillus sp. FJAT-42315]|uniref:hypothetical protein n=1 Tax=Bacillus sp. FJAT-42315 TaxID=2014077 RepID=UPI000C245E7C|nr:hypothetical protein [Bacillus sp. FJAT-42315]
MSQSNIRKVMWGSILLGLLSVVLMNTDIPTMLSSQMSVNPVRVLKVIVLFSLLFGLVSFFKLEEMEREKSPQ